MSTRQKIFLVAIIVTSSIFAQQVSKIDNQVPPRIKQEKVPPEVQKIIDETMSGQHGLGHFDEHKIDMGFDNSTKLSDLRAGEPFKIYKILRDSLVDENIPMTAMVKAANVWWWGVPVLIDGKCVTTFEIWKTPTNSNWHRGIFHGGHKGRYDDWQKVREAWPESAGYHPVIVLFSEWTSFFHVPEKDDSNLTPLFRSPYDSLSMAANPSYEVLMPSKITLRYMKAHLHARPNQNGGAK